MSIAIVNTKGPADGLAMQESLDLAMMYGNLEQKVGLFFLNDGVFQILKGQNPEQINVKNSAKTLGALTFYDIEDIFICQQSANTRSIKQDDITVDAEWLSMDHMRQKLEEYNHILRF